MGKASINKVSCGNCGEELDSSWARQSSRPPCPRCGGGGGGDGGGGGSGIAIQLEIVSELNFAGSVNAVMHPQGTTRDWSQRWAELEREWAEIDSPIEETMSGITINSAHHRLQSFFIQAYHLKDALITDPNTGLSKEDVESTVSDDPRLASLADLANLDKHFQLSKPPRSGDKPNIGSVSGLQRGSGDGWRLQVEIAHLGKKLDGLDVAAQALSAWREKIEEWALL